MYKRIRPRNIGMALLGKRIINVETVKTTSSAGQRVTSIENMTFDDGSRLELVAVQREEAPHAVEGVLYRQQKPKGKRRSRPVVTEVEMAKMDCPFPPGADADL